MAGDAHGCFLSYGAKRKLKEMVVTGDARHCFASLNQTEPIANWYYTLLS
jgi:hypothetical protein